MRSHTPAVIDEAGIAARFGEEAQTVTAWTALLNFPRPLRGRTWDADRVDAWVQANRPQSWSNRTEADEVPSPPGRTPRSCGLRTADIADAYGLSPSTARNWARAEGFPAPDAEGRRPADAVAAWVREHRPWAWADHIGSDRVQDLPEGHPEDLLDIGTYATIMGNALRGEPYERRTLLSYKSRGQIPPPDRTPSDGKTPRVFEDMWFRRTIYADLRSRRPGKRRST